MAKDPKARYERARMRHIRFPVTSVLALCVLSCTIDAPTGQGIAPQQQQRMGAPPGPAMAPANRSQAAMVRIGAQLDGKVELSGAQIQPAQLVAGEPVKMTLFFKVLETVPNDYVVFVHIEDVDGRAERINIDHRPMGGNYPTTQWKKGEVVRDEFGILIPAGMPIRGVNVYTGLWDPQTDKRMKVTNATAIKTDGADRILVGAIPVAQQ